MANEAFRGWLVLLIPLLPLLAALAGYALRRHARLAGWLGLGALAASGVISCLLLGYDRSFFYAPWFYLPDIGSLVTSQGTLPGLPVPLAFYLDQPHLLFTLTTALIGAAVLFYALRERQDDPQAGGFHATLTLFAGAMLLFLATDTLLITYLAWELMGVCSYLLIAHPGTAGARLAARRAFWTTRATDSGLLFAVIILSARFGWATIRDVDVMSFLKQTIEQANQAGLDPMPLVAGHVTWIAAVAVLVLLAVVGKSAQWPLCFWLPDAMVAPAPVSALLHAATMVAAGPFLLINLRALFSPVTFGEMTQAFPISQLPIVLAVLGGSFTLLIGGLLALAADDPKRVLAYSTVSHLGLVVLAVGLQIPNSGYLHLLAHGWFKAALFLGVGYLVAVHGGGHAAAKLADLAGAAARRPLLVWGVLLPASLSLMGLPFLAGATGKEMIALTLAAISPLGSGAALQLGRALPYANVSWGIATVLLALAIPVTAAYITRLCVVLTQRPPHATPVGDPLPTGEPAPAERGWAPALWTASGLALLGSVIGGVIYRQWLAGAPLLADPLLVQLQPEGPARQQVMLLLLALTLLGAGLAWYFTAVAPHTAPLRGALAGLVRFFTHGMYLREFWVGLIGGSGELLAVVCGQADINLVDWLALRLGVVGRGLAALAHWTDDHVVDGARWLICEFWWGLKRLHSRWLQTGQIQHYMFIILLSTVVLCFVIVRPLAAIFTNVLKPLFEEGRL